MSQRNSADTRDGDVVQKQQLNVYTVMLIVAFVAISIACLLLYLELRRWGSFPWWSADSGVAMAPVGQSEAPLPSPWQLPLEGSRPTWS